MQLPCTARYQQIARRAQWLVLLRMQHGQARNSSCSGFQVSQVRSMQSSGSRIGACNDGFGNKLLGCLGSLVAAFV